jgi:hypothetical protein
MDLAVGVLWNRPGSSTEEPSDLGRVSRCFVTEERLHRCSVCDLAKIFFTSKFSYLLFVNPNIETNTGISNRCGTTNSKPLGPIIIMGQSETLSSSEIIFSTLFFLRCASCCALYYPLHTLQLRWAKTIFLNPILLCRVKYWALLGSKLHLSWYKARHPKSQLT